MSDDPTARILELLARLETGQAGLAERLDRTRIELMARMDRLQDALAVQRDEEVVNLGAAERAERIATLTQDVVRSLSEQMTVMVRQIHRLQSEVRELRGEA
jgi:predicted transcriptional regulator